MQAIQQRRPSLWRRLAAVLLPLLVIAAGAAMALTLLSTRPLAERRPPERRPALVAVERVALTDYQVQVRAYGTVRAARQIELKPRVDGEVITVAAAFEPGGLVAAGQALLNLDAADYQLALRQRQSELAQIDAELEIEAANRAAAEKDLKLLNRQLDPVQRNLVLRQPQRDRLEAQRAVAQANIELAKLQLQRTEVRAPFDAVVLATAVNQGAQVTPASSLATLAATDRFWVEVTVPLKELRWLALPSGGVDELDVPVSLFDEGAWGEGESRSGRVIRLAAQLVDESRMARLIIAVDDPLGLASDQPALLLGAYLRVEIQGQRLTEVAVIDNELLRDGDRVWLLDADQRLAIRPVTVLYRAADKAVIDAGLATGEQLITSDLIAPVAGMALRLEGGGERAAETVAKEGRYVQRQES